MRKISANYIIPISSPPVKNGIITIDDTGKILNLSENEDSYEFSGVEFYNGVIVPGFVNSHCHLELSGLKNKISKGKGMVSFISQLVNLRNQQSEIQKLSEINNADRLMYENGIVAVGDILNSGITHELKEKSKIIYYNFIELFGLNSKENEKVMNHAVSLISIFKNNSSVIPHTFHTVNKKLFYDITDRGKQNNWPLSIHNQESYDEIQLFEKHQGALQKYLSAYCNGENLWYNSYSENIALLSEIETNILFVHNTWSTPKDIDIISRLIKNPYFVICPGSNLFIENKLPDIDLFYSKNINLTIGTDSYASNTRLDILEEIKIIKQHFPSIPFPDVLQWATLNGARALGFDNKLGSIEVGKQPGLILINQFDFINFEPSKESKIKVIA